MATRSGSTAVGSLLIRHARPVRFRSQRELSRARSAGTGAGADAAEKHEPIDLRVAGGTVVEIGPELARHEEEILDVDGGYLIPGLWDAHAHLDQEAARRDRLDTSATRSAEEALALVADRLQELPRDGRPVSIQAFGHRLSAWPRVPTVAELDAVTGAVPTVLLSGDVHSGWLNSAALGILGLPTASTSDPGEPLREDPWFAVVDRLDELPGTRELRESGFHALFRDMAARGVTGVVDMSWTAPGSLPALFSRMEVLSRGPTPLPRIRSAVYRDGLEDSIAAGLRTGDAMPGSPRAGDGAALITRGPLKIIADGSLGTASAHVKEAYPAGIGSEHPFGIANVSGRELTALLARAREAGYEAAVHAIGDASIEEVAAAFAGSGARGRIEHAQLMPVGSFTEPGSAFARLVAHGIGFSVQPAHLVDDWAMVERIWPGRKDRAFPFASMIAGGARLALGSDAPVAALDSWLAMAAAVGRVTASGEVWSPRERLSAEEALASSVDGAGPMGIGSTADLVVVGANPLTLDAGALAQVRPLATLVCGAVTFQS